MDNSMLPIDTRQKNDFLKDCFYELRSLPQMTPFLILQDIPRYMLPDNRFGIYDFMYINKNEPTFSLVQRNLKEWQYSHLCDFMTDLQRIFTAVSDYMFSDEVEQAVCEKMIARVKSIQNRFYERFVSYRAEIVKKKVVAQKKEEERPKERPKEVEKMPTLSEKLEMVFLLRHQGNNESYLRSIGTMYGIGKETSEEYTITLDNRNNSWIKFIAKDGV